MKKLPLLTLTALSAIGILWACGGGDDSDDSIVPYDAGPDVPIRYDTGVDAPDPALGQGTAFCEGTLGLIRNAVASCCSVAETSSLSVDLFKNAASYTTKCEQTLERSIGQHRTSPKSQDFDACLNGYAAVFGADAGACGGLDKYRSIDVLSPSCATAFIGKGEENDPCAGDFDCTPGTVCIGYSDTADGKCQTPAPQNGTCGVASGSGAPPVDFAISPGQSCSGNLYCANGNCQPTLIVEDAGCTSDPMCGNGGLCLDQRCSPPPLPGPRYAAGGYCHTSEDCNTGLFCDQKIVPPNDGGAPPGATGTCAPSLANSAAEGCGAPNTGIDHVCLGRCDGANCQPLCTFP